jgi:hypothetical protein
MVILEYKRAMARRIKGPVKICVTFFMPGGRSNVQKPHTGKPHLDSLLKAVMDALKNAGAWDDDSQVCEVMASKFYAPKGYGGRANLSANMTGLLVKKAVNNLLEARVWKRKKRKTIWKRCLRLSRKPTPK